MRTPLGCMGVALLALTAGGCAGAAYSNLPCDKCNVKYATVMKHTERKVFCVVDGKEIDCTKHPEECPQCRK